jgi:transcriptional regulator with XRE-family HTH domain
MTLGRIGAVLKKLREAKGLSQQALSKKAKVTGAYIAMLETGVRNNPTIDTLKRLAKALDVPVGELLK